MKRKIKTFILRRIAKIRISNFERRYNLFPLEQQEVLKLCKSVIRQFGTEIIYSPIATNILIKGATRTIMLKNNEAIIISGTTNISVQIDRELKDEVLKTIDSFAEHKMQLVSKYYKEIIKNINNEIVNE